MVELLENFSDFYNVSEGISNAPLYIKTYVCIFSSAAIVGTVGNLTVILVIVVSKKLRQIRNTFLISLALSDLLVCCITMPSSMLGAIYGKNWFVERRQLCIFFASICAPVCQVSMYSMACIAMTRYFFVCRYNVYVVHFTRNRTLIYVCLIWLLGFVVHFPNHVGWGEVRYAYLSRVCSLDTSTQSYVYFYALFILLMITVTLVFYLKMYLVIRRSPASLRFILGHRKPSTRLRTCSDRSVKQENDENVFVEEETVPQPLSAPRFGFVSDEFLIIKTSFKMFFTFFLSWTPLCVLFFLQFYVRVPPWLALYSGLLAHCNSALNFFLYFVDNSLFYNELFKCTMFRSRLNSRSTY